MGVVKAYFDELASTPELAAGILNTSCAGIALFHSHAPFADVYEIAESCCEMGKKESHKPDNNGNYVDFHYCHSGITNELDIIRKEQESAFTFRPYSLNMFEEFMRIGYILHTIGRRNVKSLGESIVRGNSYYRFDVQRICSRLSENQSEFLALLEKYMGKEDQLKRMIYDISIVYDLWFRGDDNV